MKTTIMQHGTMVPFTSKEFARLRHELLQEGFADSSESADTAYGGPTFHNGTILATLDSVTVFGMAYWRVRIHSTEKPTTHP